MTQISVGTQTGRHARHSRISVSHYSLRLAVLRYWAHAPLRDIDILVTRRFDGLQLSSDALNFLWIEFLNLRSSRIGPLRVSGTT